MEVGDLSLYMAQRRAEMQDLELATQRKDDLAQTARDRAAVVARRVVRRTEVAVPDAPQVSTPALAEAVPDVAMDELMAIRSALAAIPEFPTEPVAPRASVTPAPAPRSYPAAEKFDWAGSDTAFDWANPAPSPVPTRPLATPRPGLIARGIGAVWSLLGSCARLIGLMVHSALRILWRTIGPYVTKASAAVLGWGLAAALLPYEIFAAVVAHMKGQDLRYFD